MRSLQTRMMLVMRMNNQRLAAEVCIGDNSNGECGIDADIGRCIVRVCVYLGMHDADINTDADGDDDV